MKKSIILVLMLCLVLVLSACGGESAPEGSGAQEALASNEAQYSVTVVDGAGVPYTEGVIVRFVQGGQQAAMQVIDENGTAAKTLEKGEYTVELLFTGDESEYYYDNTGLTLTPDQTELQIVLSKTMAAQGTPLYVDGAECVAYPVEAGSTYVELVKDQRNYYLFTPAVAGTYAFSVAEQEAQIGYYGAPHFVQTQSAAEVTDNTFTISVSASMIGTDGTGTTVIVLGIDAGSLEGATLTIQRTGEPQYDISEEPWTIYQKTVELAPYTLPAGAKLGEFDLTAATDAYNLVLNEEDGFYHLDSVDGPLVLMRLGENNKYLDCFQVILEHSGVVKYFFDENGAFEKKESYSECLLEYFDYMDEETGVYPLTEDLKYIVQQRGEYSGWWNESDSLYLFVDEGGNKIPGINPELAWLFMCCYIAAE